MTGSMDTRVIKPLSLTIRLGFLLDPIFYLTIALFAGEATLNVVGIPVHLHSSAMYVILLVGIVLGLRKPMKLRMNWFFVLYGYILLRSISLNPEILTDYWLPNLITLVLFCLLYGYCADSKENLHAFLKYTYGFLMILMLLGLAKAAMGSDRLAVFGGPNGYYKFALFFHALSYIKFLNCKKTRYVLLMAVGVLLSLLTGSRGAVATLCILLPVEMWYYLFLSRRSLRKIGFRFFQLLVILIVAVVVLVILINVNPRMSDAWTRVDDIFDADFGKQTSVAARSRLLVVAWELFCEAPVFGKGGMFMYLNPATKGYYAHNVFFEILSEYGLVGFLLLWAVLLKLLGGMKKMLMENLTYASLYLGFLIYFLGAQFSGNILDSKVFLCFGMLILLYRKHHMEQVTRAVHSVKNYIKPEADDL